MRSFKSLARIGLLSAAFAAPLGAAADDPAWIPVNPQAFAPSATDSATWSAFDDIWMCQIVPRALDRFYTTEPTGFIVTFR